MRSKAAIGASLDDHRFDPSSLVYWRNRIAKSARPHRINDAVNKVVEQTGLLVEATTGAAATHET